MNTTEIKKDLTNKKLNITRNFNAPLEKVWQAWTEAELLDKWWAPKPWKAVTKSMDFKNDGLWLYKMTGPDGEGQWCRVDIKTVDAPNGFTAVATFCDEDGNIIPGFPPMHWDNKFYVTETGTRYEAELSFNELADLEQIVAMGFEQGFTMGLGNLDELLAE